MGDAFEMFAHAQDAPKVTIFGSARTTEHDPLYAAAKEVAYRLAIEGWMVITGAGPGIMQAGMEGAGREHSIGVSIRLPFETGANPIIAGDHKHVSMKYFFTRKLMLIKEAKGFVCLPGGFGTLDEMFELLTLTQTGKGVPVPIVLLDTPGDPYWETVHDFIDEQLVQRGLVSSSDMWAPRWCCGCGWHPRMPSWQRSTSGSGICAPRARSTASSRSRSSARKPTVPTCLAWGWCSPSTAMAICVP
jgi:uncharacterized protein (TIGR00730 family)